MQVIQGHVRWLLLGLLAMLVSLGATGCVGPVLSRTLYEQNGVRIGLETDPTVQRASPPVQNAHPATLTAEQVAVLLGALRVSGWSGMIGGLLQTPPEIPVFSQPELNLVAAPISQAFSRALPTDRVTFSLQKPGAPYSRDQTAGALFLRDGLLHVVLADHYAFLRADTGGGEDERDPRDTKGMKLDVIPSRAAAVPLGKQPKWGPLALVHLSYDVQTVLAAQGTAAQVPATGSAAPSPDAVPPSKLPSTTQESDDLKNQVRELTSSNLELRERLRAQSQELQQLRDELQRLQQDLRGKSKGSPRSRPQN